MTEPRPPEPEPAAAPREVFAAFASGREVLAAFWGAGGAGGLAVPGCVSLPVGTEVIVRVRIGGIAAFDVPGRIGGHTTPGAGHGARTYVAFTSEARATELFDAAWRDVPDLPRRRHPRAALERAVGYGPTPAPADLALGQTVDVSVGGACIEAPRVYPPETGLYLRLDPLRLRVRVRWSTPGAPGRMGVAFSDTPRVRAALTRFLRRAQTRGAGPPRP